ncbi:hypothetical protein XENOCAPTIV_024804 [Xenoophorus captivus]|uniref:Uncharacterized protein n=1 Tax=Xenoophorus captivus TaxID=1517983 RepID=A0ABV0QMX7_9TELE
MGGEGDTGVAISDEVGDRLHDIPGVFPPSQPGQDPKLRRHVRHAAPEDPGGTTLRLLTELLSHLHKQYSL